MASESSITGSDEDLGGLLDDVEATFQYTSLDDLTTSLYTFSNDAIERDPNNSYDHTVLVTAFPFQLETFLDSERPIMKSFRMLYFISSQALVLTMPGTPHEVAAAAFEYNLLLKIERMNCLDEIRDTRSATTTIGDVRKQPDGAWGPRRVLYLTGALEVEVSESRRALHRDARLWLEKQGSHVTQVVTIKIFCGRPEIIFEVWTAGPDPAHHHQPTASLQQEVNVIVGIIAS